MDIATLARHPFAQALAEAATRHRRLAEDLVGRLRRRLTAPPPAPAAATEAAATVHALRQGRIDAALAHSERLLAAAPQREQSVALRARALAAAGQDEAAQRLLVAWSRRHGAPPALLAEAADLALRRGDQAEAERLLAAAAEADPNRIASVERWLDLRRRTGGEVGWLEGLRRLVADPRAWWARVRLGRHCLERGDDARALRFYADAVAGNDARALAAAVGDLVRAGLPAQALGLARDRYDDERHGAEAGLAVLDACTACGETAWGRAVLDGLFMRHRHVLRERLQACANRFLRLLAEQERAARLGGAPVPAVAPLLAPPLAVVEAGPRLARLEHPAWWCALRWPEWLLAPATGAPLTVVAFAADDDDPEARALALALAAHAQDVARLRCGRPAALALPARADRGVEGVDPEDVAAVLAAAAGDAPPTSLAGAVARGADGWEVVLVLRDAEGGERARWRSSGDAAAVLHALEAQLADGFGGQADPLWRIERGEALVHTARCRGRAVDLLLAQRGLAPRAGVLDDCALIEAALARAQGDDGMAALLAIALLAGDQAAGSTLHAGYAEAARALAASWPRRSSAQRATPLLLWVAGAPEFTVRRDELLADARGAYAEWLAAIGSEADGFVVIEDEAA